MDSRSVKLFCLLPLIFIHLIFNYATARSLHLQKRATFYIANETACVVDSIVYYNGDPIPTDDPCEACKCRPPGFACVLKECEVKPGCRAVRRTGHCCPEYVCGCEHNGRMYRDGDEIRDSENPCYTCHCQGTSIACSFQDCFFRVDCVPEYIPGECCPRYNCPGLGGKSNESYTEENAIAAEVFSTSPPTSEAAKASPAVTDSVTRLIYSTPGGNEIPKGQPDDNEDMESRENIGNDVKDEKPEIAVVTDAKADYSTEATKESPEVPSTEVSKDAPPTLLYVPKEKDQEVPEASDDVPPAPQSAEDNSEKTEQPNDAVKSESKIPVTENPVREASEKQYDAAEPHKTVDDLYYVKTDVTDGKESTEKIGEVPKPDPTVLSEIHDSQANPHEISEEKPEEGTTKVASTPLLKHSAEAFSETSVDSGDAIQTTSIVSEDSSKTISVESSPAIEESSDLPGSSAKDESLSSLSSPATPVLLHSDVEEKAHSDSHPKDVDIQSEGEKKVPEKQDVPEAVEIEELAVEGHPTVKGGDDELESVKQPQEEPSVSLLNTELEITPGEKRDNVVTETSAQPHATSVKKAEAVETTSEADGDKVITKREGKEDEKHVEDHTEVSEEGIEKVEETDSEKVAEADSGKVEKSKEEVNSDAPPQTSEQDEIAKIHTAGGVHVYIDESIKDIQGEKTSVDDVVMQYSSTEQQEQSKSISSTWPTDSESISVMETTVSKVMVEATAEIMV